MPELVHDTFVTYEDGEPVYYYEIYEKTDKGYEMVEESDEYFDTMTEAEHAAEKRCEKLEGMK